MKLTPNIVLALLTVTFRDVSGQELYEDFFLRGKGKKKSSKSPKQTSPPDDKALPDQETQTVPLDTIPEANYIFAFNCSNIPYVEDFEGQYARRITINFRANALYIGRVYSYVADHADLFLDVLDCENGRFEIESYTEKEIVDMELLTDGNDAVAIGESELWYNDPNSGWKVQDPWGTSDSYRCLSTDPSIPAVWSSYNITGGACCRELDFSKGGTDHAHYCS